VAEVGQTLVPGVFQDVRNQSWLIILAELVEGELPVLFIDVRIKVFVVSGKAVSPRVVKPNVEALVSKEEGK